MAFDLEALKKSFFDREAITGAVDKGTRKALSKFGAFVRKNSRQSIKRKKGVSPPGSPPYAHGAANIKRIFFGYDQAARSVVIGPVLAGSMSGAPERLEEGGTYKGRRYAARPFMLPAFKTELQKVGNDFRNLIK